MISGAIIAGGKSSRMGIDKATIQYNNTSFLQRAITLVSEFVTPVFVSSNLDYSDINIPIIKDIVKDIGPIGGIYSILTKITTQKVLIIPVDAPLLTKNSISILLNNYKDENLITIYKTSDGLQMLVGIYDKKLLPIIEKQIADKDYKLQNLLDKVTSQTIEAKVIIDDEFININTKSELINLNKKYQ